MPWKFKTTETKSEVSNFHQIRMAKFLMINCVQELPENELAVVSATNESVEDRVQVMETDSKAAIRGLLLIFPSL